MRIAMTGSGYMANLMAKAVLDSGHDLVAIIDNGRTVKGFRRKFDPFLASIVSGNSRINGIARKRRIPIVYIDKMTEEELAPLRATQPDLILVGGFSIILKSPIISLPRIGCINCHSSLLPKHRGPNPFQSVIIAGETETGVTYHVIDEGIDTGPIIEQYSIPLTNNDTAGSLVRRTAQLAAEKLPALLARVEREGIQGQRQTEESACYDKKLVGEDLYIDWKKSAIEIDRMVRGCFPFSMARFRYKGTTIIVSRAKALEGSSDQPPGTIVSVRPFVRVATAQGTLAIMVGYNTRKPVPWVWPGIFWRPQIGDRVD